MIGSIVDALPASTTSKRVYPCPTREINTKAVVRNGVAPPSRKLARVPEVATTPTSNTSRVSTDLRGARARRLAKTIMSLGKATKNPGSHESAISQPSPEAHQGNARS
jgi:hypothetical protein